MKFSMLLGTAFEKEKYHCQFMYVFIGKFVDSIDGRCFKLVPAERPVLFFELSSNIIRLRQKANIIPMR